MHIDICVQVTDQSNIEMLIQILVKITELIVRRKYYFKVLISPNIYIKKYLFKYWMG